MEYQLKPLVRRAKTGDNSAAEEILKKVKPLILSCISSCCSSFGIDDLYQEAAIEVLYSIKNFDESRGIPFLAFLKKRIYYKLKNLTRYHHQALSLDEPITDDGSELTLADMIADTEHSIEEMLERKQQFQRLYAAMECITSKQRYVLQLHYGQGIPMAEIARRSGLHYQAVVQLKDRALKKLKAFMENDI